MQITPGMRVGDVCSFCFEHTIDQPCPAYDNWAENEAAEASKWNIWGSLKADIDPEEFCVECEQFVPRHYTTCPLNDDNPHEEY